MKKKSLSKLNANLLEIPKNFLEATYDQLVKDLRMVGIAESEIDRSRINIQGLERYSLEVLKELHQSELNSFMQLLYIIDIPEPISNAFIKGTISIEELNKWILIREWKKVEFRSRFSAP